MYIRYTANKPKSNNITLVICLIQKESNKSTRYDMNGREGIPSKSMQHSKQMVHL